MLLRAVRKGEPLPPPAQALVLRYILEDFAKYGVTAIWSKDGDLGISRIYEELLRYDSLPVRAILDFCHTPFHGHADLARYAERNAEIRAAGLPEGFLRADGVKLLIDMPTDTHQAWLFEPYADGKGDSGFPVFGADERWWQTREADALGLTLNYLAIGDRAVHEALDLVERLRREGPPRFRRPSVEHAEFVRDDDIPRFKALDVVPIFNWIGAYADPPYQVKFEALMGRERIARRYQRWKDLMAAGATVANGSDFPLGPADPLCGMHVMVNGTDLKGEPKGGLWPHKQIGIEQALRTYTVNGAYARGEELKSGMLRPGYDADFVILAENILAPGFDCHGLPWVKVNATVMNGHVVHEDFSAKDKVIDFGH